MSDPRVIPSIDLLRQRQGVRRLESRFGAAATIDALRQAADELRQTLRTGGAAVVAHDSAGAADWIEAAADRGLASRFRGSLRSVINATGVIIHTNLGRAPLAASARDRLADAARGYSNLEYDLATGGRGSRSVHAEALITSLTGAEAAVVVNNNAAATLLILAALAKGREAIVSRGELVEIGGGFRVPDVMAQSGAVLREVGTTNKTRVADYTAAIGERTALVMRVHPSNFRIEGFTERPALAALARAVHDAGSILIEDLGSGCLVEDVADEPTAQASLRDGADLVCFSGDKLLGGPQAGIIAGRRALVDQVRRHPLMRALRADKLTYAALEATLLEYLAGRARETVPVQRMLHISADEIEARVQAMAEPLAEAGWTVSLVSGSSAVGGGSAPGVSLPTVLLALAHPRMSAVDIEARLRALDPPIVARIEHDRVVLDLRTVAPEDDAAVAGLIGVLALST
jgi:L-seryl-tRNA(Ser) seleniumtransferase